MFKILLALHLLFAIFAIGPLVHAATTASRGIRTGDGAATARSARLLRIYGYASVVVVLLGIGLMSIKRTVYYSYCSSVGSSQTCAPRRPSSAAIASFGDTWIWLSLVLYVVAIAVLLVILVPTLKRATAAITAEDSVVSMTGRVAASGGVIALLFAAIVVLMVYKPGG